MIVPTFRLISILFTTELYKTTCFNSQKFHYIAYSTSLSSNSYNVYANPNMEIINPSDNVLDLGIFMSSNFMKKVINVTSKLRYYSHFVTGHIYSLQT